MIRSLLMAGVLTAAMAVPAALAQSPFSAPDAPVRTITVTGEGRASARPDIAFVTFTVLRNAKTARDALDAANRGMTEVFDGMRTEGVEDRDLQTSGFAMAPQYRFEQRQDGTQSPPEIVGYEVRNTLTVRVRALDKLGTVLDRAVSLGANEGGDIRFDFTDPDGLLGSARRAAVADAKATAGTLAEAAGVKLGALVEMTTETGAMPQPPMPMLRMAAEAAPQSVPVATGENTITANVRMVFEIAP